MTDRESGQFESDRFVIDSSYLREQALDAARMFVALLSGVYNAIIGAKRDVSDERSKSAPDSDCKRDRAI